MRTVWAADCVFVKGSAESCFAAARDPTQRRRGLADGSAARARRESSTGRVPRKRTAPRRGERRQRERERETQRRVSETEEEEVVAREHQRGERNKREGRKKRENLKTEEPGMWAEEVKPDWRVDIWLPEPPAQAKGSEPALAWASPWTSTSTEITRPRKQVLLQANRFRFKTSSVERFRRKP